MKIVQVIKNVQDWIVQAYTNKITQSI